MRETNGLKHIFCELYDVDIYWAVCSRDEYSQLIKKKFGEEGPTTTKAVSASYAEYTKKGVSVCVLWFSPKSDVGIVAHECFHPAHSILQSKGVWLTESSEEAYTYLLQWLVRKILLWKPRKKPRKKRGKAMRTAKARDG